MGTASRVFQLAVLLGSIFFKLTLIMMWLPSLLLMATLTPLQGQGVGSSIKDPWAIEGDLSYDTGLSFDEEVPRAYTDQGYLAKRFEIYGFGVINNSGVAEKCKKWTSKEENLRTAGTFEYYNFDGEDVCPSLEANDKNGDGTVTLR